MRKTFDFVVVGAGFAGAVTAEQLASAGKSVLVVEKRPYPGGNAHDHRAENGIMVHDYGPHIFHTENEKAFRYLSRFTDWLPYQHRVRARIANQEFTLPVNLTTLTELLPLPRADQLAAKLIAAAAPDSSITILKLRQSSDPDLQELASIIYEKFYLNYSRKQWGIDPDLLDPQVTGRLPVRADHDDRYFQDKYQGIPADGYTALFKRLLDQPKIEVLYNTDYQEIREQLNYQALIYTGALDSFFKYHFGELPYRSLGFDFSTLPQAQFQPVAVVNYPGAEPFTRITEFKYFTNQRSPSTIILREFPEKHEPGKNIPCYPIPLKKNFQLRDRYLSMAQPNVYFLGRLAEYCYYNMDQVTAKALYLAAELVNR